MRKLFSFVILCFIIGCNNPVEKPQNILSKDQMADVFVDLAIYDNSYAINQSSNMQGVSKYILQKNHITEKTFEESYTYYVSKNNQLEDIYNMAQEKILKMNPKIKNYIEKNTPKGGMPYK